MGDLEQAENYHQRAIRMKIYVIGPNRIDVAKGLVYDSVGEREQDRDYHQRAMEIYIIV